MGKRVQAVCQVIVDDYGGDASRIWTEPRTAPISAPGCWLAGFGPTRPASSSRSSRSGSGAARRMGDGRRSVLRRHAAVRRRHRLRRDVARVREWKQAMKKQGKTKARLTWRPPRSTPRVAPACSISRPRCRRSNSPLLLRQRRRGRRSTAIATSPACAPMCSTATWTGPVRPSGARRNSRLGPARRSTMCAPNGRVAPRARVARGRGRTGDGVHRVRRLDHEQDIRAAVGLDGVRDDALVPALAALALARSEGVTRRAARHP